MPIKLEGFTARQERVLRQAFAVVKMKVRDARLPRDLASELRDRLATTGQTVYLTYRGNEDECGAKTKSGGGGKSYTVGLAQIYLCEKAFTALYKGKPRLGAILFHELVHTCGGEELDAETYENLLFGGEGATPPDERDFKKRFHGDSFKGKWLAMNRQTRDVTEKKSRRHVFKFAPPPRAR